jgi:hypothetical protein
MNMLLEQFLLLLLMLAMLFQVIIPIFSGKQVFPIFRKKTWTDAAAARAARHLDQANTELDAARMEAEARKIEAEVKKFNQQ